MKTTIKINANRLAEEFRQFEDELRDILIDTLLEAKEIWADQYEDDILRQAILDPLSARVTGTFEGAITVNDPEATRRLVQIESGHSAWDMKPGLLASPKARPYGSRMGQGTGAKQLGRRNVAAIQAKKKNPPARSGADKYIVIPFRGNYRKSILKELREERRMNRGIVARGITPNDWHQADAIAYAMAGENEQFKTINKDTIGWIYPAKPARPSNENLELELEEMVRERLAQRLSAYKK